MGDKARVSNKYRVTLETGAILDFDDISSCDVQWCGGKGGDASALFSATGGASSFAPAGVLKLYSSYFNSAGWVNERTAAIIPINRVVSAVVVQRGVVENEHR